MTSDIYMEIWDIDFFVEYNMRSLLMYEKSAANHSIPTT